MNSSSPKHEREKRRGPKRSESESSLDYFSKFEVQKTGKKDKRRSLEDLSSDTECSSTESSSTTSKDQLYSDNNLDLPKPKRVSKDSGLTRERSVSCSTEGGHFRDDLKEKTGVRPAVVKRDSWFLIKQKMKVETSEEKSNVNEGREENDQQENIDSKRQFRGETSQGKPLTDVPASKDKTTLLTMASQSESEKEDSGLSSSASFDTKNPPRGCASAQINSEREIPGNEPKPVAAIVEDPKNTKIPDVKTLTEDNKVEETTPVEINPPLPKHTVEAEPKKKDKSFENKENLPRKSDTKPDENEDLIEKEFQNDIKFIHWEAKRSLRSEEYLQRARKRYRPKSHKPNAAVVVLGTVCKNPAAGVLMSFCN
jgi:hypothetical protein